MLNDARVFTVVHNVVCYLQSQPILGNFGIFNPEFRNIGDVSDVIQRNLLFLDVVTNNYAFYYVAESLL